MSEPTFESDFEKISIMRSQDKSVTALFLILFLASVVLTFALVFCFGYSPYNALPAMAIPFFVIGLINYISERRYFAMLFLLGATVFLAFALPEGVLFLLYIFVCAGGVATMVEILQRKTFYRILRSVEFVNVKEKLSFFDRVTVFFFNVPVDLDTRDITLDHMVNRSRLPWKDMLNSMLLALIFCIFLWIYVFLNPAISIGTSGVPIYTFTIVLYISVLVMPWSIFSSLNVKIKTDYRDFKLYSGLLETMKRMFLPIFAAIALLVFAVSSNPDDILYIGMSLLMIVVMITVTSVVYYTNNEISVINDILDAWNRFCPVSIYSGYSKEDKSSMGDDVPGTPRRDPRECFRTDLRNQAR